jgi:hypothetical protein
VNFYDIIDRKLEKQRRARQRAERVARRKQNDKPYAATNASDD